MPWADRVAVLGLVVSLVVAACGASTLPVSSGAPATAAAATAAPATAAATAAAAAPSSPSPSPAADATPAPLVVDDGLLAILPATVAGVAMQPATYTATGMAADLSLQRSASAVAVGMVLAPGDLGADDLAIASVIQLRPGIGTDAFYTQWRDEYDAGACEPAGGVASHAQQTIGSHPTEVTICAGGARTYHTRLPGDLLVSVTAVGDRGFGDLVIAGLRG